MTNVNSGYVYLASPIDLSQASNRLMEFITESLGDVVVFDPASAWGVPTGAPPSSVIQSVNMQALTRSAAVVGVLTGGPSLGVPSEVALAMTHDIPVVLFVSHELLDRSWFLHWLLEQDNLAGAFSYRVDSDPAPASPGPGQNERFVIEPVSGALADFSTSRGGISPEEIRPYFAGLASAKSFNRQDSVMIMPFKVGPDGTLPTRGHQFDAGMDLYVSQDVVVPPHEFVDIPTDVAGALPDYHWGMLTGRSSALRKHGLLVHTGIIDQGYRGELFAGVMNLTDGPVTVHKGDRIAQLIPVPMPYATVTPMRVADLPEGERGDAGFGSTGV